MSFTTFTSADVHSYYSIRVPKLRLADQAWLRGPCPNHNGKDDNFAVNTATGQWRCHSKCGRGGDILSLEMELTGAKFPEAKKAVFEAIGKHEEPRNGSAVDAKAKLQRRFVCSYDYVDATGKTLFQVRRYQETNRETGQTDKTFRQYLPTADGWINKGPDSEAKALFRLPQILATDRVILVEGEKDVLALEALGLTASTAPGGARAPWMPQYTQSLGGKRIAIIPDADQPGHDHALKIASALHQAGIQVRVTPAVPVGKDVSDWIGAGATREDIVQFINSAPDWQPPVKMDPSAQQAPPKFWGFDENLGLKPSLANAIMREHSFAKDAGGALYVFAKGCYVPENGLIRKLTRDYLENWGLLPKWRGPLGDEIRAYIGDCDTPLLDQFPSVDVINVANGLLDVNTLQLRPHEPAHLSSIQLPVSFDIDAQCPAWEDFVTATFPADAFDLAWELVAFLITPDTSYQKAVLLSGAGGNGKSVLLDGIQALLGRTNIASRSLHELEDDRFASSDLVGKLANVCADLPAAHLRSTSQFKAIVSGDRIPAQRKHQPAFSFAPFSRLVFSANSLPKSNDASDGFYRRWLVVPFERTFEGSRRRSKRELDAELQAPRELSGLLNRGLSALHRLRRRGFSDPPSIVRAVSEFREVTDSLAVWLERKTVRQPDGRIDCKELLFRFNEEVCRVNGQAFMSSHSLTKSLKEKGIERRKSFTEYYAGIAWRSE